MAPLRQVLYVGEAADFAEAGLEALEASDGVEVASVPTGTDAVDYLARTRVSCLVCRATLPDVDVPTFLDGIRELAGDLPVVVVSETRDEDLAATVLSYDATDFVHWRGEAHQPERVARRVENAADRRGAELTAERTAAYFDALVNQAPDAIITIDETSEIVFANRAVERVFGYDPEALIGESLTLLIPERMREDHLDAFSRYRRTGTRTLDWDYVELVGRHADGHEVPVALSFREVTYGGRRLFTAIVRDVSQRARAEDERRLLHAAVRSVAEAETFLDGLRAAIASVCDATDWAYGEAWVPDEDGAHLERTSAAYAVSEAYEPFQRVSGATSFAPGEGLPGRVWEAGDWVWMENVAALSREVFPRTEWAETVGLKAALGVPIVDDGEVVAVLAFYMPDEREVDDRLVDVVTTVATELGELVARKQVEDELKERTEFIESALDALPDIFFAFDFEGNLLRWNEKVIDVTGYTDAELAEIHPLDFFRDEETGRVVEAIERVRREGRARIEAPLRTKDGREIPYEFTGALLEDDDGQSLGIAGIGRDVSDRKQREAELEASREKYRRLVETAPDAVFIVDAESGTILDTNTGAERLLGKPRDEIVGMHQSALHPPEEAERYRRIFEDHVDEGGVVREADDYYVVTDDGEEVPVEISAGVTEIGDRTLNQAVFRDISDHKRREETLETLREVTRDLMTAETKREICDLTVETARDILDLPITGIHLVDEDGRALEPATATPEADALFDEIPTFEAGQGLAWRVYEEGTARLYDSVSDREEAYNRETPVQTEMILPLGDHGVLTSGSTESETLTESTFDLAKILAANAHAALDRAEREQTIARQRRKLEAELDEVFERVDDAFFALDDEWRFTYVNEQARRLLGADDADLRGRPVWDAVPEMRDSEAHDALRRAVETQDPVTFERYFDPFDAWFEVHAYPSETGLSVYFRDVSERKHREQKLERQNERLESFASMLAHELRNPLSIAQIYLRSAANGDEEAFEEVETALDRIDETIDVLLVMARGGDSVIEPEPVSLRESATEAWSTLDADPDRLVVETDLTLAAEPHHVQNLLENLFRNAMEHGGRDVTVRVGALDGDAGNERPQGDVAGFYVADDGTGIPEEERGRVFEAGYTTGESGLGLGLTFITQLAEAYGWECRLTESEAGGARFEFENVDVEP